MTSKTIVLALALAIGAPITVAASQASAQVQVIVRRRPPAVRFEVRPPRPHQYAIWVQGHWVYDGYRYEWRPGYWETPRAGYVYVQPRWYYSRGAWRLSEGRWRDDPYWARRHRRDMWEAERERRFRERQALRDARRNDRWAERDAHRRDRWGEREHDRRWRRD